MQSVIITNKEKLDFKNTVKFSWDSNKSNSIFKIKEVNSLTGKEISGISDSFKEKLKNIDLLILDLTEENLITNVPSEDMNLNYYSVWYDHKRWVDYFKEALLDYEQKVYILYNRGLIFDSPDFTDYNKYSQLAEEMKGNYREYNLDNILEADQLTKFEFINDLFYRNELAQRQKEARNYKAHCLKNDVIFPLSKSDINKIRRNQENTTYDNFLNDFKYRDILVEKEKYSQYFKLNNDFLTYLDDNFIGNQLETYSYIKNNDFFYFSTLMVKFSKKINSQYFVIFFFIKDLNNYPVDFFKELIDYINEISSLKKVNYHNLIKRLDPHFRIEETTKDTNQETYKQSEKLDQIDDKLEMNFSDLNHKMASYRKQFFFFFLRIISEFTDQVNDLSEKMQNKFDKEEIRLSQNHLKALFGDKWNMLHKHTKQYLITSDNIYNHLEEYNTQLDYSPAVISLTKALENELNLHFFKALIDYCKGRFGKNYKKWPNGITNKYNTKPQKYFSLGSLTYLFHKEKQRNILFDMIDKDNKNKTKKIIIKKSFKKKSNWKDFHLKLNKIRKNYRNRVAHKDRIPMTMAKECRNFMLEVEKFFIDFTNYLWTTN